MSAVKLSEVAKAAGVSVGTASQALRGVGDVSAKTTAHVRRVAERLGYQPNAAGALLAAGRHRGGGPQRPVLAMVSRDAAAGGFVEACEAIGYMGKVIDPGRGEHLPATLRRLWHEGVEGLLIANTMGISGNEWDTPELKRFALVKLGRILPGLPMNTVRMSAAAAARMTLEKALERGYRRIMVQYFESQSETDDIIRSGITLHYREHHLPAGTHLEISRFTEQVRPVLDEATAAAFMKEVKRIRPDAVLGFPIHPYFFLKERGFRIPEEIAFAGTTISSAHDSGRTSGCLDRVEAQLRRAVLRLHHALLTNERGLAAEPDELVMSPAWHEGSTLPDRKRP
ncbi:MAG: LacI family DNA-binding transcriptional regulator [Verrucomicrobia bacterium]|jgi:LacI family transcriptional regulator|nr:LacI family DNA-binding transcriptional regulator [Verrucomicrobiota bacterium]